MNESNQIRAERAALRCSQITLARLAGMSRYRLSMFECGYRSLTNDELSRLRRALAQVSGSGQANQKRGPSHV